MNIYKTCTTMQRKFTLFLAFLFVAFVTCTAQSILSPHGAIASTNAADGLLDIDNDTWSLYADEENKLYYIDFESLSVNLSDIVVKRKSGEVVLKEDVFELPVNTIYEIDFKQYGPGNYDIELRTFTGVLRRSVQIK